MFTMIDWRYRHSRAPLEHFRLELGLYRQNLEGELPPQEGRWRATPLVEQVRAYIADSVGSVGPLAPSALAPALKTDACKAHARATMPDAKAFTPEQTQPSLVEND
jgi:hypothetical protein